MKLFKKLALTLVAVVMCGGVLTACSDTQADRVSYNISKEADSFHIERRIVFVNGITDKYLLEIDGLCSLGNHDGRRKVTVTCKTGPNEYKKHTLGLSDNVTYFSEQLESADVSAFHYKVIFAPETIVPDIDLQTSGNQ